MNNKLNIKKHNGEISLLKFLFSLLIIAYHMERYGKFRFGYLGVELFFIISGYYFCDNVIHDGFNSNVSRSSLSFLKNKILKFLPYYILLFIVAIPNSIFINNFTKNDFILSIMCLFTVPNYEMKVYSAHGITWYINAMILVEFIIYPLLLKFKDKIINIVSPIVIFFTFTFLMINFKSIVDPWQTTTFCYKGLIRAFMDINIGIFMYGILSKLRDVRLTDFSRFLMTSLEVIGYILIFYLANKNASVVEVIILFLIILCLSITLSEKDYLYDICNNSFFYHLEKLSLPIYIFQFIFIDALMFFNDKYSWNLSFKSSFVIIIIFFNIMGNNSFEII